MDEDTGTRSRAGSFGDPVPVPIPPCHKRGEARFAAETLRRRVVVAAGDYHHSITSASIRLSV